ncbi:MAG: hypothetical protein CMI08_06430 [Oceanospirillaceae bacterium]|uniref:restriction endonuclease subunit S n=1 Tax=unclassified Thalassolituus TaxID=2624967 RepID=UPI000C366424|nr:MULTISPECIES: restriction endonuclease subunit S [unclassified Thalassolituus]MAS25196.1 hypothetical protein [Oceanospirillaceae bacterium]MAX98830.1 hypothetical protein [Oceanospirillaceae bacterium]MBS53941.1 hypothetical protein [Oceanospirillaceae bacterium]|tara:strand:- start:1897 stop:3384 length:1488 start_codon:yes stop_codon:yes gene_type:complete
MGSEWEKLLLSEVANSINTGLDAIRRAPIIEGPSEIRCLRIQDISQSKPFEQWGYTETKPQDYQKYQLKRDDIIMARTCSTGINYLVKQDMDAVFNNGLARIRLDTNRIYPEFAYYVFQSADFASFIDGISGGTSVQLNMKVGDLARYPVMLPSLKEQKNIAQILGALDNKIALNRQINTTLESMAQALFKSWFVDFDPVIDNALAAGNEIPDELAARAARREALRQQTSKTTNKTTGATGAVSVEQALPETGLSDQRLPPEIQQLFPDRFVLTEEMGWVPEGWEVDQLSSYINVKHGFAFKGEYFSDKETSDVLLTPGNIAIGGGYKGDKLKFYEGPIDSEYILQEGDLILTMTDLSKQADTLGYPALVPFDEEKRYLHNQRLGKVELKKEVFGFGWLYYFFCSQAYRDEILSGMSGTTVKHTSPKKIMANKIVTPEKALLQNFEKTVSALLRKKSLLLQENKTLSNLRDSLLPKLLSGQITIPDAEQQLAEVL